MRTRMLHDFAQQGIELVYQEDAVLYELMEREYQKQRDTLAMVASSSITDPSVLACEASAVINVTAEGYPNRRYHAGCSVIDEIEQLAIDRAKALFKAQYANVQPHSASSANEIVMFSLLKAGDTILGMELEHGGHLTHGAKASISGQVFNALGYGLNQQGEIHYDQVYDLAKRYRPKLIICGATAYPRVVDFGKFREIADEVGAFLLADITHIAGLVVAGVHPSSIDHAHVTTTCTHKQLYGPRGGLLLMGRDYLNPAPDGKRTLSDLMQSGVFPMFQGSPVENVIAAKARAFARLMRPEFRELARQIVANARALAQSFMNKGYRVISSGSDNHIVLVDVAGNGFSGIIAEKALEESSIIVNKNKIPGDRKPATVTSGIRLGTNSVSLREMGPNEMAHIVGLMDRVFNAVTVLGDREYVLNPEVKRSVQSDVKELCRAFPIPRYPVQSFDELSVPAHA